MKFLSFLLALAITFAPLSQLHAQPAEGDAAKTAKKTPPKNATLPIITLTKTDGTTVRGKLVTAEPFKVVLRIEDPVAKTSADEPFSWFEIAKLSNGLTRAKTIETFKAEHKPEELCETCKGNMDARCETCKGTRHAPGAVADCTTCKGELLVDCKTPKCEEGQIPCPNKCLKLSEGKWYKKDDKLWRNFVTSKGTSSFSESHVGELIAREGDQWISKGKCPTCDGKSTLSDPACEATGKIPCPVHSKAEGNPCTTCESTGRIGCAACQGTGLKSGALPPAPEAQPTPETPAPASETPATTPPAPNDSPSNAAGGDPSPAP